MVRDRTRPLGGILVRIPCWHGDTETATRGMIARGRVGSGGDEVDEEPIDRPGRGESERNPDPFACGLISILLLVVVAAWLVLVYLISRSW